MRGRLKHGPCQVFSGLFELNVLTIVPRKRSVGKMKWPRNVSHKAFS